MRRGGCGTPCTQAGDARSTVIAECQLSGLAARLFRRITCGMNRYIGQPYSCTVEAIMPSVRVARSGSRLHVAADNACARFLRSL